ncbi:MAG: hypothetical protein JNM94_10470 [Phycisphaerae bacterium]|nr:hypothetical protein [Phycisphaerae bacterium]
MQAIPASALTPDEKQTSTTTLDGMSGVLVSPLPLQETLGGRVLAQVATVVGVAMLVLASMWVSAALSGGLMRTVRSSAIGAGIGLAIYVVVTLVRAFTRKGRADDFIKECGAPWGVAVAECARDAPTFGTRAAADDVWRRLLARPDRPRVLVDEKLAPKIAEIPIVANLLEPEPIAESKRGMLAPAFVFLWLTGMSFLDRRPDIWWRLIVFPLLSIWFFTRVPAIRDRIPLLRATGRDLVAGPGWLRRKDDRRWNASDSIAIVMRSTHRGRRSDRAMGVVVRFVGPIGVRDVTFASVSTADFELLWQRWMHPHPRYDLSA